MMGRPVTHAASLEEIAAAEGTTVAAVNMAINRALKKLRSQRLLITCREFAAELERNRKGIVE
jgi:DNA-binding CsgD family transcriptional regulator